MLNEQILSYIRGARSSNIPDTQIENVLLQQGWRQGDINEAFLVVKNQPVSSVTPIQQPVSIPISKDSNNMLPLRKISSSFMSALFDERWYALENILMSISLYIMATAISLMLHFFIDKWYPESSTWTSFASITSFVNDWSLLMLRIYIAALLISWPSFTICFLLVMKQRVNNPLLTHIHVARTLRYITLAITFLAIELTLISFLFAYLNGEITRNLILHEITTIIISSIVFVYYVLQEKE